MRDQVRIQEDLKKQQLSRQLLFSPRNQMLASAARQALESLSFCLFLPTDSYWQLAAGPSQAQVATGWSRKRKQMEGAGALLLEVSKGTDCIFAF